MEDVLIGTKHLEDDVEDHIPFGLYGINLKPPADSRIAWSDVGGLTNAKQMLVETLKWPTQVRKWPICLSFQINASHNIQYSFLSSLSLLFNLVPKIIRPMSHSIALGSSFVRSSRNWQNDARPSRSHRMRRQLYQHQGPTQ